MLCLTIVLPQKSVCEMDRKRTRSSDRKQKQAKKVHNTGTKTDSNPLLKLEDNESNERQNTTQCSWLRQDVNRNTASAVIGGFPIPEHNFPTPFDPQERDGDSHPLIEEVNLAIRKLNGYRVNMFDPCGKNLPDRKVLSRMKMLIENETLPILTKHLKHEYIQQSDNPNETLYPNSRDTLVNIGAGFFTVGLFLIMMGSNTDNGAEATAANYHLEKGVYQVDGTVCQSCGHKNCNPASGCNPNVRREIDYSRRRWL